MNKPVNENEFSALLRHVERQVKLDPGFERTFEIDALNNAAYRRAKIRLVKHLYLAD